MNLFDFLMSNAFILVVIAGFIFNIMKSYREQAKPQRKASPPLRRKAAENEVDVRSEVEEAKRFQKQAASIQAKLEEAKAFSRTQPPVEKRNPLVVSSPPVLRKERRGRYSLTFSKKQAMQGVIWSEILGPPKAKRK